LDSPILIVGAGRSGTKLLRAILGAHPTLGIFPREINYIWRHGNIAFPTDELLPQHAYPEVRRYIRERFEQRSRQLGGRRIVEKTCANVLRVGFIHSVFPEAHIIHLVRDGRAVAESARRRWVAPPDLRYLAEKLAWVPLTDMPYYGLRYLYFQAGRLASRTGAPKSWGPRYTGQQDIPPGISLIEKCGLQWRACVLAGEAGLHQLPANLGMTVRYENLVRDPVETTQRILSHVGVPFATECRDYIESHVTGAYLEHWRDALSEEDMALLLPHISSDLVGLGYEA
jgi:hypothetical protein